MIYMAAALYPEAEPFIRALGLKKQKEHTRFQVFASDTHTLILTGSGSLAAGIAVTYLLTCAGQVSAVGSDTSAAIGSGTVAATGTRGGDLFVQLGSCGAPTDVPVGSLFLCHKITDAVTGRSVYPDMLYRSPFRERALVTVPEPSYVPDALTDMEGYGGYLAAFTFLPPNRIFTFKVVSDRKINRHGIAYTEHNSMTDSAQISGELQMTFPQVTIGKLTELMASHTDSILSWLRETEAVIREESAVNDRITDFVSGQAAILSKRYSFSVTNRLQLEKLLRYGYLCGRDMDALIAELTAKTVTSRTTITLPDPDNTSTGTPAHAVNPNKIKAEGRRFLHELNQRLLS